MRVLDVAEIASRWNGRSPSPAAPPPTRAGPAAGSGPGRVAPRAGLNSTTSWCLSTTAMPLSDARMMRSRTCDIVRARLRLHPLGVAGVEDTERPGLRSRGRSMPRSRRAPPPEQFPHLNRTFQRMSSVLAEAFRQLHGRLSDKVRPVFTSRYAELHRAGFARTGACVTGPSNSVEFLGSTVPRPGWRPRRRLRPRPQGRGRCHPG